MADISIQSTSELDNEEWRPVVDYEDIYIVSSSGRIMRVLAGHGTHVGLILKPRKWKWLE